MIEAVKIKDSPDLHSALLWERVRAGHNNKTLEFTILRDGSEVGLLIYEDFQPHDGFVY